MVKTTQNRSKKRRADRVPNTPIVIVNLVKKEKKKKKKKQSQRQKKKKKKKKKKNRILPTSQLAAVYAVTDITIKCMNQNKGTCMLI